MSTGLFWDVRVDARGELPFDLTECPEGVHTLRDVRDPEGAQTLCMSLQESDPVGAAAQVAGWLWNCRDASGRLPNFDGVIVSMLPGAEALYPAYLPPEYDGTAVFDFELDRIGLFARLEPDDFGV